MKRFLFALMFMPMFGFGQKIEDYVSSIESLFNFETMFEKNTTNFKYLSAINAYQYNSKLVIPPPPREVIYNMLKNCVFSTQDVKEIRVSKSVFSFSIYLYDDKCSSFTEKNGMLVDSRDTPIINFMKTSDYTESEKVMFLNLMKGAFPNKPIIFDK